MKTDGLLGRNWLAGEMGDAMHAILCGAGHNLRLILAHLRVLIAALIIGLMQSLRRPPTPNSGGLMALA